MIKCSYHDNVSCADPCMTYFVLSLFPVYSTTLPHSMDFLAVIQLDAFHTIVPSPPYAGTEGD